MENRSPVDFWYAVNNTRVLSLPERRLETFGSTVLNYHLVTELMDAVGQVKIREGRMEAFRPEIITPEAYAKIALDGFGKEASEYLDWLKEHSKDFQIMKYGYNLKQESYSEHTVTDSVEAVTERVKAEVKQKDDPFSAVLVGVDEPWDVCLIKLFVEMIQRSAKSNFDQIAHRQIEEAFHSANNDSARINALGATLQRFGVFEEYQDRFFSLVKGRSR